MAPKNSENKIINGLKSGDESSYNKLYNEYYLILSVFAGRYVKDLDIAREIVQDLFVHLYEIRKSLVITTSLKAYLYQSVRNKCLNLILQNQLHEDHLEKIKINEISSTGVEEEIMEIELEHQVYKIVSQLPDQCQKIFTLSRVDGKKNREIAENLNISIRTVETQISKAIRILRNKLHDYIKS
jgi:RNA polymerase sigma-70 factor (family 1)